MGATSRARTSVLLRSAQNLVPGVWMMRSKLPQPRLRTTWKTISLYFATANQILRETNASAEDRGGYATAVFRHFELLKSDGISEKTRAHVAEELLASGLPAPALELIRGDMPDGNGPVGELAARAMLELGDAEGALSAVADVDTATAARLRAEAFEALGRYNDAQASWTEAEDYVEASSTAWRAGDWQAALSSDDTELRTMATFMLRREAPDTLPDEESEPQLSLQRDAFVSAPPEIGETVTLDAARDIQTQSQTIRAFVAEVLDDQSAAEETR